MANERGLLELKNLKRSWGKKTVFQELQLQVIQGEFLVLLGPSGCGKSTLLRAAASLDLPDDGEVLLRGQPVVTSDPGRMMVLQDDRQLFPWLNVVENVAFPGRLGLGCQRNPQELLSLVHLSDGGNLYPSQLSGGMRQRAVLARALAAGPEILLLDEPFAALDVDTRHRLQDMLDTVRRSESLTIFLVTHDVVEALRCADRLLLMDSDGRLESWKTPEEPKPRDPDSVAFHRQVVALRRRLTLLAGNGDGDSAD